MVSHDNFEIKRIKLTIIDFVHINNVKGKIQFEFQFCPYWMPSKE